jgi:integrase
MANTIKILFWLNKSKTNRSGTAPLMLRLTHQNRRTERATGFYLAPKNWHTEKQKVKSTDVTSVEINNWMNAIKAKVIALLRDEEEIHLPSILSNIFSTGKDEPTLLGIFREHNKRLKERVGSDYTYSTFEKYVFTLNKVKTFITSVLKQKDIFLKDLKTEFIIDFDHYLRSKELNQHNTAVKYCLNLKKVLNEAVLRGLLKSNPFQHYKTVYKETPQVYLQQEEIYMIEKADLKTAKHQLVRDLFLFQCHTGLAYTDMTTLATKDFSIDTQGRIWIIKQRQKTGITCYIPLLPKAQEILSKYQNSSQQKPGLLPFYSIQKYNQYLNEIAVIAELNKPLSSHVGRRTFGNIALSKGISINVISKILGHSNTIVTQKIYAITTQNIVRNEIDKW